AFDTRAFWDKDFYKKLAKRKADKWVTVGDINLKRKGKIQAPSYVQFTEVFAALGWIGLIWDDNLEKRPSSYHFPYKSACITELGKVMLAKLFEARSKFDWHGLDPYYNPDIIRKIVVVRKRQAEETKAMGMQSFLSYERDWDNIEIPDEPEEKFADAFLSLLSTTEPIRSWYPIKRPFVQGQYKFKVALDKDLYRVIALDAHQSLKDLHLAIQAVYSFDNDHLYSFYLEGSYDDNNTYVDSRGSMDGIPAEAVDIGEIGLYKGKQFVYLFDFGADWSFDISVLDIDSEAAPLQKFELLESVGESPEQYPYYGDDDDEW
ncbi:MAG: hypothetical protein AAF599_07270, partial [Bacteroidota bacterium]